MELLKEYRNAQFYCARVYSVEYRQISYVGLDIAQHILYAVKNIESLSVVRDYKNKKHTLSIQLRRLSTPKEITFDQADEADFIYNIVKEDWRVNGMGEY